MTTESDRDAIAWAAIAGVKGIGPAAVRRIVVGLDGEPAGVLLDLEERDLLARLQGFGAKPETAAAIRQALSDPRPLDTLPGVAVIHPDSAEYPRELHPRRPLPALLYTRGPAHLLQQPSVAVVGSRDASATDLELTRAVAKSLALRGFNVVSGHARGVDHQAHAGALQAEGTTTAVLAEGLGQLKPRDGLEDSNPGSLLFVSEFRHDERWRPRQAMRRNATMRGLVRGVIATRCGQSGGTREMVEKSAASDLPVLVPAGSIEGSVPEGVQEIEGEPDAIVAALVRALDSGVGEPSTGRLFV